MKCSALYRLKPKFHLQALKSLHSFEIFGGEVLEHVLCTEAGPLVEWGLGHVHILCERCFVLTGSIRESLVCCKLYHSMEVL